MRRRYKSDTSIGTSVTFAVTSNGRALDHILWRVHEGENGRATITGECLCRETPLTTLQLAAILPYSLAGGPRFGAWWPIS